MTDDEIRDWWRELGGSFHGPKVEHGTMPESKLLPLLRRLLRESELLKTAYLAGHDDGKSAANYEPDLRGRDWRRFADKYRIHHC